MDHHEPQLLVCPGEGPKIESERDVVQMIVDAHRQDAVMVVIPVERLSAEFFDLKTRIAGEILQKFVNYRMRLAIVGDIAQYVAGSRSLRDLVYEANRGRQFWFVANRDELGNRLRAEE